MLTVTDLVTFSFCPRRLYAVRRLGYREPLTKEMVFGTVVHETAEFLTSDLLRVPPSELKGASSKRLRRTLSRVLLKNKSSLTKTGWVMMDCFKQAHPLLERFGTAREDIISDIVRAKGTIRVEVPIESKRLQLRGRIDELRTIDDTQIPVELKSGKVPSEGVWAYHKIQLAAYALLLEDRGSVVSHACVSYVAQGSERHVGLNPFLRDEVLELRDRAVQVLEQPHPPTSGCGECEACKVLSRSTAR